MNKKIAAALMMFTLTTLSLAAQNAPRLATPEAARGFSGTLTGAVTAAEWNGRWANLRIAEAVPDDPERSSAAEALVGQTVSVLVTWEQGPDGLRPKAEEAEFLKGLQRGREVVLEASVNRRGHLQLRGVPEEVATAPESAPAPAAEPEIPEDTVRAPNPLRTRNGVEWGWVPVGGGGNMMMTAYHPQNPHLKVLRSDVAGLFIKDEPGQEVWRPMLLSSSLGLEDRDMRHPSSAALHPSDDNTFYTSTRRGIYKTTDRARTWNLIHEVDMRIAHHSKKRSEPLAIDPQNPEVVYAGTWAGELLRSLDGGAAWQRIPGIPTPDFGDRQRDYGIPCVVVDPASPQVDGRSGTVYFGGFDIGIFRSTDGGDSFHRISDQLTHPHHMRIDSLGALYVSNDDKGLFRFENDTWSDALLDRTLGFAIDPTNPDRIVAAGGNVMRSLDRGRTWTAWAGRDGNVLRRSAGWWRAWGNQWPVPNSLSINPHNPDEALLVTVYTAYQNDNIWGDGDALNIWDMVAQGVEMTVAFDALTPPGLDVFFTSYGDISGLRHHNLVDYPGEDDVTPGHVVPSLDYHAGDPRQIWGTRVGGWKYHGVHILKTTDAGDNWERLDSPFGSGRDMAMAHIAVSATNPDNAVVLSVIDDDDGNQYTLDGGETWQASQNLPGNLQGHNPREYWFFGNILASDKVESRFYAYNYRTGGGNRGRLWTSVDGAEWTVAADNLPSSGGREKQVDIDTAYNRAGWVAVTSPWAQSAHLSQDAGQTWERLEGFEDVWSVSYGKSRPGSDNPTLFVLGQQEDGPHGVYHSPDFFESDNPTWNYLNHPEVPMINPRNIVGCLQEYGRAFIADAGRSWMYVRQPGLADR